MTVDVGSVGVLVGNALLTVATALSGYAARRAHKTGRKIDRLSADSLTRQIREAVVEELSTAQGEETRALLNAIIYHTVEPDRRE